jgi:hypothetical protein
MINMMTYELKVKNLNIPSFDGIRCIANNQLQANFLREENDGMYNELKRGTTVIRREELLWCYLLAFGRKHQAKIYAALSKIKNLAEIVGSEYSIIDWGCGILRCAFGTEPTFYHTFIGHRNQYHNFDGCSRLGCGSCSG